MGWHGTKIYHPPSPRCFVWEGPDATDRGKRKTYRQPVAPTHYHSITHTYTHTTVCSHRPNNVLIDPYLWNTDKDKNYIQQGDQGSESKHHIVSILALHPGTEDGTED